MGDTRVWSYATTTDILVDVPRHRVSERDLCAAVLHRALLDIETEDGQAAVDAYHWLTRGHYALRFYCAALGIDSRRVAGVISNRYGERVAAIRKRLQADMERAYRREMKSERRA